MSEIELPNDVLLVEDNLIIAIDTEMLLAEIGVPKIRSAASVATALRLIEQSPPDFAVIDVNLGEGSGYDVAKVLFARGIRFIFATGYAELMEPPPELANAPIISKPYTSDALKIALTQHKTS